MPEEVPTDSDEAAVGQDLLTPSSPTHTEVVDVDDAVMQFFRLQYTRIMREKGVIH